MPEIIPLRIWYPAMYDKWTPSTVPREEREAWVVHHTAGGAGLDPLAYARRVADDHWAKWKRPGGYSFLVGSDAVVREMCGFDARGVHSGTHYWNYHGLALSFQGSFMSHPPTDAMLAAGAEVIAEIPLPQTTHRKVRPTYTDCPGDALIALLPLEAEMTKDEILAELGLTVAELGAIKQLRSAAVAAGRTVSFEAPLTNLFKYEKAKSFPGAGSGLTEKQVKAIINDSQIVAPG